MAIEAPFDMASAREWCDSELLRPVEGIWEFPDDDTRILIKRSPVSQYDYDLILISSPDVRFTPGDIVGSFKRGNVPDEFSISLYRDKTLKGAFTNPGSGRARLAADGNSIKVENPSLKVAFNARWLLPSFWKALKLSRKSPSSSGYGIVRIYPLDTLEPESPDYL